ncbi:MAG: hypothetical protein AAB432_00365 [Patescibacteria group bacterium]
MDVNFIDSESCEIEGERMLYFKDPRQLRDSIIKTIETVGAVKLFSSTDEAVKKTRESIAEFFFILSLKIVNNQDWFLMQPKDDPPDFTLMTASDNPMEITLDQFELVEIPGRCRVFDEMMKIIQGKLDKGYLENQYNLLIFVNNENSSAWISLLNKQLRRYHPFKTVWTVHLLWHKDKSFYSCVVNRLRPFPIKHIETPLSDDGLGKSRPIPTFMEEIRLGDKVLLIFKSDFVKELTKVMRKINLARLQVKNKKEKFL